MFVFGSWVAGPAIRRAAVAVALTLSATTWMITAGQVPPALACDGNHHCYAEGVTSGSNHGDLGFVYINCLSQPNNGNFATNEIWDSSSDNSYWEEAGVISGVDPNSNYDDKNWFWADSRPGGGFNFHLPSTSEAGLGTSYVTEIDYGGNNTWFLHGGNTDFLLGESVNQTASITVGIGGTEYFGGSGSGIRDVGQVTGLEIETTSNNWKFWGSAGGEQILGPNNYIPGFYDSSSSGTYWHGPC